MKSTIKFTGKSIVTGNELNIKITRISSDDAKIVHEVGFVDKMFIQTLKNLVAELEANNDALRPG